MSDGLKEKAKELGLWNGRGEFNFTDAFSTMCTDDCQRFGNGSMLLKELTSKPTKFAARNMMDILRNEESGICMREGMFLSTSSQVFSLTRIFDFMEFNCYLFIPFLSATGVCS